MIIDFTIKNFRSFKDVSTLSLEALPLKEEKKPVIYKTKFGMEILPAIGIFGPNASGKSNIIKALSYMQWAVMNSNYLNQPTNAHPFLQPYALNEHSVKKPIHFEITLWDKVNNNEFRYGFEVSSERIEAEWLEVIDRPKKYKRTRLIFERNKQEIKFDESVEEELSILKNKVLPTALAISVFAQFANEAAATFVNLMNTKNIHMVDGASHNQIQESMDKCLKDEILLTKVISFLKATDTSIDEVSLNKEILNDDIIKQMPKELKPFFENQKEIFNYKAQTAHKAYDNKGNRIPSQRVVFDIVNNESFGTQKLFGLSAVIIEALENGQTLVFDEFGSSLHPFITQKIVQMFQNKKTNQYGAQLIFSSHETFLLAKRLLRRDQIWFTEKNNSEASSLRCLAEYKTRNDYEIAKRYLEGRFGAVPIVSFEEE